MRYKNSKTGAVIDSPFNISGGDWIEETLDCAAPVTEVAPVLVEDVPAEKEEKNGPDDSDDVTKKEIMQELDAMGIKYDSRSKKQELYDLMIGK